MGVGRIMVYFYTDASGQLVGQGLFQAAGGDTPQPLGDPQPITEGTTMWFDPSCIECDVQTQVGSGTGQALHPPEGGAQPAERPQEPARASTPPTRTPQARGPQGGGGRK